jgi:hypothetical protein
MKDEIAGICFGGELQMLAPAHARLAANHVDDAFEMAVMVRAGFGIGLDRHRTGPQLLAPARAKLIAALRSIPGVEGTLGSSWSPGMTRTPSCFQRSASSWE